MMDKLERLKKDYKHIKSEGVDSPALFKRVIGYLGDLKAYLSIGTASSPDNKPLTVEALIQRNKPVWVDCRPTKFTDNAGYYALCNNGFIVPPSGTCYTAVELISIGWVFLDRPPEMMGLGRAIDSAQASGGGQSDSRAEN